MDVVVKIGLGSYFNNCKCEWIELNCCYDNNSMFWFYFVVVVEGCVDGLVFVNVDGC